VTHIEIKHGPGVARIIAALGDVRFVGGCVRDALAGLIAKDIDFATPLPPQDVIAALEAAGIRAVPTGIDHGTITAVSDDEHAEVTTLRRDVSTDGRRATIAYTDNWREDAARRDFTINALYADPKTGVVFDPFGGVDDLRAGVVRFIGAPLDRIAEDHLRILRFFRFHARFGTGAPDSAALSACTVRANDLMALSRERIAAELLSILSLPHPGAVITLMIDCGIFVPVLPEITDATLLFSLVEAENKAGIAADPVRRLAALIGPNAARAEDIGGRLKLSNAQKKRLIDASKWQGEGPHDPREHAYWAGVETAQDRRLLAGLDVDALHNWTPPQFPMTGGALVSRGVQKGPEVARILRAIERQWVSEGFPSANRVETIADQLTQNG
jgi:poly(A) polymerase